MEGTIRLVAHEIITPCGFVFNLPAHFQRGFGGAELRRKQGGDVHVARSAGAGERKTGHVGEGVDETAAAGNPETLPGGHLWSDAGARAENEV